MSAFMAGQYMTSLARLFDLTIPRCDLCIRLSIVLRKLGGMTIRLPLYTMLSRTDSWSLSQSIVGLQMESHSLCLAILFVWCSWEFQAPFLLLTGFPSTFQVLWITYRSYLLYHFPLPRFPLGTPLIKRLIYTLWFPICTSRWYHTTAVWSSSFVSS